MDTSKEIPPDLAVRLFRASLGRGLLSWSKKLEYYVSEDQVSRLGNSDLVPKMIKSGHLDCIFYLLKKMKENGAHISFLRFVQSLSLAVEKSEKKLTDALLDSPHYLDFFIQNAIKQNEVRSGGGQHSGRKNNKNMLVYLEKYAFNKKEALEKAINQKSFDASVYLAKDMTEKDIDGVKTSLRKVHQPRFIEGKLEFLAAVRAQASKEGLSEISTKKEKPKTPAKPSRKIL